MKGCSQIYYEHTETRGKVILGSEAAEHRWYFIAVRLGIAIPDLNFQSRDSGLSNSQSRDPGIPSGLARYVKSTKIATWVTVFGSLFLSYKCVRSCYGFSADVLETVQ